MPFNWHFNIHIEKNHNMFLLKNNDFEILPKTEEDFSSNTDRG
jgi:hypothetical protein